ncbi:hypothetical protein RZS08_04185, partial [Arthrospira platensis SPKY1]|nr:hypothetical protein [Arthrospira platensis SPKY1]
MTAGPARAGRSTAVRLQTEAGHRGHQRPCLRLQLAGHLRRVRRVRRALLRRPVHLADRLADLGDALVLLAAALLDLGHGARDPVDRRDHLLHRRAGLRHQGVARGD